MNVLLRWILSKRPHHLIQLAYLNCVFTKFSEVVEQTFEFLHLFLSAVTGHHLLINIYNMDRI
jgi:hypothetical protein